ncbi:MAG: hypothetical protein KAJ40_02885 [Alphaproteobacteria bacterium]|nr:hypothetical protein [Alphaproteobacteria bacterium]
MSVSHEVIASAGRKTDIFERFKKDLPELPLASQEKFLELSKSVTKKPYGEDVLAYSMRIDKDWTEGVDRTSTNFILSEKLFLELSSYYGPPTISGRSRIVIEALNLEGNLTAEQWYIKYILEGGYTTEGFVAHSPNKVESLMVIMERDYSYYLRTLVMINGSKVIMVKYYIPAIFFQEQAVMQAMILNSFKLTYPVQRQYQEMLQYRFLDIAEFKYPAQWKIYARPVRSVDRLNAAVLNVRDGADNSSGKAVSAATEGKLDVTVISSAIKNTLIEEIAEYKKTIEADGMLIGKRIPEDYEFTYEKNIDFAITEVYKGMDTFENMSEYEFWFTVMVGGNYYYFMMLLTPSRNEMFGTWAENTENYKLMVANFKPMVGAFLERD